MLLSIACDASKMRVHLATEKPDDSTLQGNTASEELDRDYLLLRHATEDYKRRVLRQRKPSVTKWPSNLSGHKVRHTLGDATRNRKGRS
jgi:hypothetical protein